MKPPVMEFHGVARTYDGRPPVPALHPCSLTVDSGQYVAVVGPSGSGKSTFLNIAGLLDTPDTGRYRFDGIDVAQLGECGRSTLRGRRIGFVFQSFHLLPHRTAMANVILPMLYTAVTRTERVPRAYRALASVGLAHRVHALPTTMSGGERQRVAIARALVNQPSLLLCDEPTGNLDSATAELVLAVLEDLNQSGVTLLIVTHNEDVADRAHRILSIKDGRLEELR